MKIRCEYFERYGDSGRKGLCESPATLALVKSDVRPAIRVCGHHADTIVSRFPELGGVKDRFIPVTSLDEFGRVR